MKEELQEQQYVFPYHYLDLADYLYKNIYYVPDSVKREVLMSLIPLSGKTVVDIGCGDGRLSYDLKTRCNVEGIDVSDRAIGWARQFNPEVKFFSHDILRAPLKKKYDVAFLSEVLEHIEPKKSRVFLENISKSLKKGGKFIVTVPSTNVPLADKHYRHFSENLLRETLKPFKIDRIIGFNPKRKITYTLLEQLGLVLYLFRKRFKADWYYANLKDNFRKKAVVKPKDASILIALCTN